MDIQTPVRCDISDNTFDRLHLLSLINIDIVEKHTEQCLAWMEEDLYLHPWLPCFVLLPLVYVDTIFYQ